MQDPVHPYCNQIHSLLQTIKTRSPFIGCGFEFTQIPLYYIYKEAFKPDCKGDYNETLGK